LIPATPSRNTGDSGTRLPERHEEIGTALESVLGLGLEGGDTLRVRPCVPDAWPRFVVRLRLADGRTHYEILVENPERNAAAVVAASVDGEPAPLEDGAARIALERDGATHRVRLRLGPGGSDGESG